MARPESRGRVPGDARERLPRSARGRAHQHQGCCRARTPWAPGRAPEVRLPGIFQQAQRLNRTGARGRPHLVRPRGEATVRPERRERRGSPQRRRRRRPHRGHAGGPHRHHRGARRVLRCVLHQAGPPRRHHEGARRAEEGPRGADEVLSRCRDGGGGEPDRVREAASQPDAARRCQPTCGLTALRVEPRRAETIAPASRLRVVPPRPVQARREAARSHRQCRAGRVGSSR